MTLVLALAAMLWGIGHILRMPINARFLMIALLYVGVLLVHTVFPDGHALREALGGTVDEWVSLGFLVGIAWIYSVGLKKLRSRVRPENLPKNKEAPTSSEIERNARHIVLREIGGIGQKRLKTARVLVVGAGGLGSPVLQYLAAAGVGTIGVIDDDSVENSNLQRQVIHTDDRIGMPKVFSAEQSMRAQNPFVDVRPYHRRLTPDIATELFKDYDLILDGSDNSETRYLVNQTAVNVGIPLISGAITQWEGQISLFDPSRGGPCYACVFPEAAADGLAPSCAEGGVLGPLPGVIGAMMAVEAIKFLAGAGETLIGRLLIYDALHAETRIIAVQRQESCSICGKKQITTGDA
ncbi:MAG: HesA/MoeB/ThiF family protein [Boseongicola sp.]|nr:HesA/MoeB/ThiF family protein [Boseongicola sp.]NNJ68957.1 HesA/MoeB/ThiF family protein [Boseongicola sp.]